MSGKKEDVPGKYLLVDDLERLVADARHGQFGDFTSSVATPKVELVRRLNDIVNNTVKGKYDD